MRRETCSSLTLSAGCAAEAAHPPRNGATAHIDGYWNGARTSHFEDFDSGLVIRHLHSVEASEDVPSPNAALVGLVMGQGGDDQTSFRVIGEREPNGLAGSERDAHHVV